jgi:LPXTG-site transpeptidase (sortase) family protein
VRHRAALSPRQVLGLVTALLLVGAGLALWAHVGWFEWQYHHVGRQLAVKEQAAITRAQKIPAMCANRIGDGPMPVAAGVSIYGELEAKTIGLDAPVVEGTGNAQLAMAVGHDPSSVWPSAPGTVVLSAHDVTWFSQIGHLAAGDAIDFVSPCVTYEYTVIKTAIVKAGTPVLSNSASVLVLSSCYPFNALYLTPNRFLVEANLVKVVQVTHRPTEQPDYVVPSLPTPAALIAQGLTLSTNSAPLGTLTIDGSPSTSYQQSTAPLAVQNQLLSLYFAAIHTGEQANATWWRSIAPNVNFGLSAPLWGGLVSGYGNAIDTVVQVSGSTVTGLELEASPIVSGGFDPYLKSINRPEPQGYHLTMQADVSDGTLTITSFKMTLDTAGSAT